ncbi:interleukin-12 receptor subunit beta-1 [Heteronotia binoei]|uniref:interleukin-12 receptor subunit beta-1 n=1 Tax=Heteronotia binoei TaxID=13085 RepID=UPI00292DD433|nr:interleukin-12 receptor subunit beta-1 [Heteronotia binoei]
MEGACGSLEMGRSWHGRSLLVWGHLLRLCLAVSGMPGGRDAAGPHSLLCSKESCMARQVNCSWEAGKTPRANYTLHLRYQDQTMNEAFWAGAATSFCFDENTVSSLNNVTLWVENHTEDPGLISEKLTLQISEAVKFDAPPREKMESVKAKGTLNLKWPRPSWGCPPLKKEVRIRHNSTEGKWALGNCDYSRKEEDDDNTGKLVVLCHVEEDIPHEVQIRHRTSHWSSPWSEWSEPLIVPAEIRESPHVTYTMGQLGSDGLRNVTLEWERPSQEQGQVTYDLLFVLLPCNCTERVESVSSCRHQASLSGAGYSVSLQASNQAGRAPPFTFLLPPAEPEADLPFLHSRLSGKQLSVEWMVKTDIEAYCFEAQALGEALQGEPCIEEALSPPTMESSGTLVPNRCYRLAVHALASPEIHDSETGVWSTFAFAHLFSRNTSLEEPIQVSVTNRTADSAVLQWEPPGALSACPDALKKYIICCRDKQAGSVSYYEADTSETHYRILGLQPQTAYQVGVWASTEEEEEEERGLCQPLAFFLTHPADPKALALASSFWYLGIFGGLLTTTGIFCFGKKRAKKVLCAALPDPANTEAVKVTSLTEAAQVRLKQRFVEPLESSSLTEPFLVELQPKEEPAASCKADSPGGARQVEEFPPPKEDPVGSATVLPLEYNSQGLLAPVEDDDPGQEGRGDVAGVSTGVRAGCCRLSPSAGTVGADAAPLSLTLLETVVVATNGAGGSGFSASA